jgi:hypothetical protein
VDTCTPILNPSRILLVVLLSTGAVCAGENIMSPPDRTSIRTVTGAGQWFPARKADLTAMVANFIEKAQVPAVTGRVVAALSPHAGYIYSGHVAGYTFRALRDNAASNRAPDTVVVIGFTHRERFDGVALMDGKQIATPLGSTPIDMEAADLLTNASQRIFCRYAPHTREWSAENQIPFAQVALPRAKILVGLIGDHDARTIRELADALNALADKKNIVLISSTDMLHDADHKLVTDTDRATLAKVAAMDIAAISREWSPAKQTFCGIGPVLTAMRFAELRGCKSGQTLRYRNTGDDHPESRGQWVVVFAM